MRKLINLRRRKCDRMERDLHRGLWYHLDHRVEDLMKSGLSAAEAGRQAAMEFGGFVQVQEEVRDTWSWRWLHDLGRDVRYALRTFRRAPVFLAAVVTLSLGIGANTAVFSIADALLLKSLPVHEPQQLIQVLQPDGPGLLEYGERFSASDFRDMSDRVSPFAQLVAETDVQQTAAVIDGAPEEQVRRGIVSGNYFEVLGVGPAIGRTILPADDRERRAVAMISYGFWKRRFDLDPRILGRAVRIGNDSFQIIGVGQPGFIGLEVGSMADMWTPTALEPQQRLSVRLIGRLNSGASAIQPLGPLQGLFRQRMVEMVGQAPPGTPNNLIDRLLRLPVKGVPAGKGVSSLRADYRKPLKVVFGLVALVLLMACTTVATLFEARRTMRCREMAVRTSLGASKWRVRRQLMTENVLIALAAAVFALILAHWTTPLLVSLLAPSNTPIQLAVAFDAGILTFTAIICILTSLMFGLVPAWRSSVVDLHPMLKGGISPSRRGRLLEVVGVARRGKYLSLGEQPKPYVYFPLGQSDARAMTVLVRGTGDPTTLLQEVRDTVRAMDNTVPLYNVTTMSEHVSFALFPAKGGAAALNVVGMVALTLMALGLYGTLAYTVSRRTFEIGVRRALGAQDGDVVVLVVRQAMLQVLVGLAIGIIFGFVGSRLLRGLLYGVEAADPLVFGLAPVVLVLVSVLATWVPTYPTRQTA